MDLIGGESTAYDGDGTQDGRAVAGGDELPELGG